MRLAVLRKVPPPPTPQEMQADPDEARDRLLRGYRAMVWNGRVGALGSTLLTTSSLYLAIAVDQRLMWFWAGIVSVFGALTIRATFIAERIVMRHIDHLERHPQDWLQVEPPRTPDP